METTLTPRFSRQADLVPENRLRETAITVIGVGAIGRQVALQLTAIGAKQLTLIDFDRVDETNLATQGYRERDRKRFKVTATGEAIWEMNGNVETQLVADRFRSGQNLGEAVWSHDFLH